MAATPRVTFQSVSPAGFDHGHLAEAIQARIEARGPRRGGVLRDDARRGVDVDVEFDDDGDAASLFVWLGNRLGQAGGPTGRATYHICPHAQGEEPTVPCTDPSTGFMEEVG